LRTYKIFPTGLVFIGAPPCMMYMLMTDRSHLPTRLESFLMDPGLAT